MQDFLTEARQAALARSREAKHEIVTQGDKEKERRIARRALTPDGAAALITGYGGSVVGGFKAAAAGRLTADLGRWSRSADQTLQYANRVLRARARSLEMNSGVASGFLHMCRQNIVGEHGVKFEPRPPMLRGDGIAEDIAKRLKEAWEDFCEPENFSADGKTGIVEYVNMLVDTWARDGEAFNRVVYDPSFKYGLALDMFDPDQVDDWKWELGRADGTSIRMGVEVNKYRRPLFYHCWSEHPSEVGNGTAQMLRIPASQMLHVAMFHRPKQTRGYTWFAPVLTDIHHLDSYVEAAEIAARVGASQMAVLEQSGAEEFEGDGESDDGSVSLDMEPGSFAMLPPGVHMKPFNPQYPNISFAEFTRQCQRFVASGLGVAYHNLASDLSSVNFSSARAGVIAERDFWKSCQKMLIQQFYKPLYKAWLRLAMFTMLTDLPADFERLSKSKWHPRRWEWVDPLKDVQAKALELQNGFTTREKIAGEKGEDFLQIVEQLIREQEILKSSGLKLGTDIRGDDTSEVDSEAEGDGEREDREPQRATTAKLQGQKKPKPNGL